MNTTAHLQELLDQHRDGQAEARDALLAQSLQRVQLLAHRMFRRQGDLRALEETDDVVSKALLRLRDALLKVMPVDVKSYLGLAARHIRFVLQDLARMKGRKDLTYLAEPVDPPAPTEEPSDILEWAEFHAKVDALPEQEREVFDVLFYQGMEQAEASELLGIPLRTLKRRWQHARLALRETMQGQMPEDVF